MKEYHSPVVDDLPRFTGGAVGYLGYDSARWFEPKLASSWSDGPGSDRGSEDDAVFMLFEELIAFDHLKNQIILFSNVQIKDDSNLESDYEMALQKIDRMGEDLHEDIDYQTQKPLQR